MSFCQFIKCLLYLQGAKIEDALDQQQLHELPVDL